MKGQGFLISAFAFALVIAIFAVINVEAVQVNFLFAKTTTPLILVILVSTLLGGLTVGLFGILHIFRLQRSVKALEKRLAEFGASAAEPQGGRKPAADDETQTPEDADHADNEAEDEAADVEGREKGER